MSEAMADGGLPIAESGLGFEGRAGKIRKQVSNCQPRIRMQNDFRYATRIFPKSSSFTTVAVLPGLWWAEHRLAQPTERG
jgi:hypothetical protein